jgi:hypothetical protein
VLCLCTSKKNEEKREESILDWRNPDAPDHVPLTSECTAAAPPRPTPTSSSSSIRSTDRTFGTEKDQTYCSFFLKTGACRYGAKCSKIHLRPSQSTTLLIRHFYEPLGTATKHLNDAEDEELMVRTMSFLILVFHLITPHCTSHLTKCLSGRQHSFILRINFDIFFLDCALVHFY